jgi:hypothetical protein
MSLELELTLQSPFVEFVLEVFGHLVVRVSYSSNATDEIFSNVLHRVQIL